MNNTSIKTVGLTTLAVLLTGGALFGQALKSASGTGTVVPYRNDSALAAPPIFTNFVLDTCNNCKYDSVAGGYYVWGAANLCTPGQEQWIAMPFSFGGTATKIAKHLEAAIVDAACGTGETNTYQLGIWTDGCDPNGGGFSTGPATLLAEGRGKFATATCMTSLVTIPPTTLSPNVKYWMVARTLSPTEDKFSGIWYASNLSQIGYNLGPGAGVWAQFSGLVPAGAVSP